jgi:hypothetical protein
MLQNSKSLSMLIALITRGGTLCAANSVMRQCHATPYHGLDGYRDTHPSSPHPQLNQPSTSSPNGPLTNLCATRFFPNSGTHSALVLQNCSFWGVQSRPARSRIPAGTLMMSSFRGVSAEILEPQTLQNARRRDSPDCVSWSSYVVMFSEPVCSAYCY